MPDLGKQNLNQNAKTDSQYRRRIFSWAFYDWANHGYIATTATSFFPPYFIAIAAPAFLPAQSAGQNAAVLARDSASNVLALTISLSMLSASILSPLIGAYADITGYRKRLLLVMSLIGGILSSSMFFLTTGRWEMALIFYFATQVTIYIALGLNSSLLPHIARKNDLNRVSSLGYAMGYAGGGILLTFNAMLYLFSATLGLSSDLAVRIAFLTAGIWWITFTLPLLLYVPEPQSTPLITAKKLSPLWGTFIRLGQTLKAIRHYSELFKMLIAFWFYMEGVGAIILLATAYGAALGLDTAVLIGTLLMTQFVAYPYAIAFGYMPNMAKNYSSTILSMILWTGITFPIMGAYANINGELGIIATFAMMLGNQLVGFLFSLFIGKYLCAGLARHIDSKRAIIIGLVVYSIIPLWGYYLHTKAEFFMIGWLVGTVQGGTQALSRSIYTKLTPASKSGEFFGFYGLSEKFAGILGPLLYGFVGEITHSPRTSILSVAVFFAAGIFLLSRVDVVKGSQIAAGEEEAIKNSSVMINNS
jgi:MFS transporter, UMF1 family